MVDDRERTDREEEIKETPGQASAEDDQPAGKAGDELEALRQEVETLRTESEELLDKYRRSLADFANFRKRQERDREQEFRRLMMDVLRQFLPIVDDFRRANENVPQSLADSEWVAGVQLIERKIEKMLEQYEVTPIDALGKPFDPHFHSALVQEESDEYPAGTVAKMQRGYMMGDDVLRPTLVKVSSGPGTKDAENGDQSAA